MIEMFNYIFGVLNKNDDAVKNINKAIKAQKRAHNGLTVITLATVAYIAAMTIHVKEQNEVIAELSNDIKELKNQKGD